jgi:hypothetical protein
MIKSVVAIKENGSNIKMAGLNALYKIKIQQKSENLKKIIYLFPNRFILIQIICPKEKL